MKDLEWISKQVDPKTIDPTPNNYKIKTKLGAERLKESLKQFGLASNMVVNYHPKKKGRLVLIDGNSRLEQSLHKKAKLVWVSIPNRPLTDKEFKAMSAMFDFAKAGEVDVERIKKDLGTTTQFFQSWHMDVPMHAIDTIGKRGKKIMPTVSNKTVGADEVGTSSTITVSLFFTQTQAKKFRSQEEKMAKKFKTSNTTDTVFKKFMS